MPCRAGYSTCLVLTARCALLQLSENEAHGEHSTLAGMQQTFSMVVSDATLKARTQAWFAPGGHWVRVFSSFQYPNSFWPLGLSQILISCIFLSPTHSFRKIDEHKAVYFKRKFSVDPLSKHPLRATLLPHRHHIQTKPFGLKLKLLSHWEA